MDNLHGKLNYATQPFAPTNVRPSDTFLVLLKRFNIFHEKIYGESPESAKVRYGAEVKRVAGVLDSVLKDRDWLVGDKCTYADLAFVMWNMQIAFFMAGREGDQAWRPEEFPHFTRWQEAMLARESVKKVVGVLMDKEVKSS